MAKKVQVSQDLCIGCGLCNSLVPSVFEMGDDGLAKATVDVVADADDAAVEDAAASCPVAAITVE